MKAVVLTGYGGVDKLELREVPEPKVGARDVKVRMAGASINPVDWKLRSGALQAFMPLELPAILGRDASGVVVEVGPGVTAFKRGDRVLGRAGAAFAEMVVAPVEAWVLVPDGMDLVDAGALPLVLLTGAQLVEEAADVRAGDLVLVTGAVGAVGRAAVFAAKARGAKVLAGVRAAQKGAAAKLGADVVVALDDPEDLGALPSLDRVVDTVGGELLQKLLGHIKPGGTIGSAVGESAEAKARGLTVRPMMTHVDPKRLAELALAVAEGKLVIPIEKRFPLAEGRAAQLFAETEAHGKVLLVG